ncbi:MAG: hypothetical protein GY940_06215, partial [bacterium]|nr:hypothetical protein [bacterium]
MKRVSIIFTFLLIPISICLAQSFDYGNAWYKSNPDRPFVKLIVEQEGIYRVTAQELNATGFNMSGVNPTFLQLYYRGREIPIHVVRDAGGSLAYLDFYGKRNDGFIDSMMYRDPLSGLHMPDLQPNKAVSLFTDEAAYFLTWSNIPGKRYQVLFDPLYSLLTPESSFRYEARKTFFPDETGTAYALGGGGQYDSEYTLNSDYGTGEGYVGPKFQYQAPYTLTVPTPHPANLTGGLVDVKARVFGRSRTAHQFKLSVDNNPVLD